MALVFQNTMTRSKEDFVPIKDKEVGLYTCGPTVYDYAHIGNFRTYMFEDLLRRYLQYRGYKVTHIMNITDVDDKTIKGCQRDNVGLDEYTAKYIRAFFEDVETLGIEKAHHYPKATECINEMIELISGLLESGYAYQGEDGSVYYNISKFSDYGKLAHINVDELQAGKRVSQDEYTKDTAADFALWKAWDEDDGSVAWEGPFGKGRPGWHIECSAMSRKHLGDSFDIHCGGVDNIFPHHQNEIAQSEAFTGKKYVRYWLHSEHLIVEGKKMAKSQGNFYTLRALLDKGYTGREIRYLLLNTHYRQQLNFTIKGLDAARNSLERIDKFLTSLAYADGTGSNGEIPDLIKKTEESIVKALDDDLNISAATGSLFELVRNTNKLIETGKVSSSEGQEVISSLEKMNEIWNVFDFSKAYSTTTASTTTTTEESDEEYQWQVPEGTPKDIEDLLYERDDARAKRNFARADEIRNELTQMGYIIEDKKGGGGRLKKR